MITRYKLILFFGLFSVAGLEAMQIGSLRQSFPESINILTQINILNDKDFAKAWFENLRRSLEDSKYYPTIDLCKTRKLLDLFVKSTYFTPADIDKLQESARVAADRQFSALNELLEKSFNQVELRGVSQRIAFLGASGFFTEDQIQDLTVKARTVGMSQFRALEELVAGSSSQIDWCEVLKATDRLDESDLCSKRALSEFTTTMKAHEKARAVARARAIYLKNILKRNYDSIGDEARAKMDAEARNLKNLFVPISDSVDLREIWMEIESLGRFCPKDSIAGLGDLCRVCLVKSTQNYVQETIAEFEAGKFNFAALDKVAAKYTEIDSAGG